MFSDTMVSRKRTLEAELPLPASKRFQKDHEDDEYVERPSDEDTSEHGDISITPLDETSLDPSNAFTLAGTPRADSEARRLWNYVCDQCGKRFNRPVRLEIHKRSHTGERPFACSFKNCDKTFPRKDHLERHTASAHSEGKYPCDYEGCEKRFSTATRLKRHKETHEKQDQYRCRDFPPCNEVFRKKTTLESHIKTSHLGLKAFQCPHTDEATGLPCTHAYDTEQNLARHVGKIHSGNKYFCDICKTEPSPGLDNEGLLSPPQDPVGFPTKAGLDAHVKEAHPPFCHECNMKFSSQRSFKAHLDIVHGDPEETLKYPCPEPGCDRSFSRRGNLSVHVNSVHKKVKSWVCGEFDLSTSNQEEVKAWSGEGACGQAFGAKGSLEGHIKTQHLGLGLNRKEMRKNAKAAGGRSKKKSEQSTLSKLTGVGYENGRDIACLILDCEYRFMRDYDLKTHLSTAHELADFQIYEMIAERDALHGGQFWIGDSGEIGGVRDPNEMSVAGSSHQATPYRSPYSEEQFMDPDEAMLDAEMGLEGIDAVDVRTGVTWKAPANVDQEMCGVQGVDMFPPEGHGHDNGLMDAMMEF